VGGRGDVTEELFSDPQNSDVVWMMTSSTEVILQVTSIDFGFVVKCDRKGFTNLDRVKLLSGSGSKKAFFHLTTKKLHRCYC